ncbi:hypothetical protein GCM10027340_29750 [Marinomonas epiphytica]
MSKARRFIADPSVKLEPIGWFTGIAAITALLSREVEASNIFFMIVFLLDLKISSRAKTSYHQFIVSLFFTLSIHIMKKIDINHVDITINSKISLLS